ncbi:MAG TPA: helix-turn-helix domain-containing protein [Blastocatellia bacterium]|nr:helix-turn-helix domain-containing protein [Blastocatellia bacterium]
MAKPVFQYAQNATPSSNGSGGEQRRSPLADLVSTRLREKGMRQIDFCRQTGFDQGLLSKILSSVVNTLNVETALKLAEGLNVSPRLVFEVIGKKEVDDLLRKFYSNGGPGERLM